ncbi:MULTISPECIES: glycosyltransferase family 4 protein [Stenotrophomonas]|uniref:glycosyltransferase family 4 protein n=1 Tax=Stenotrophomonas TaxID=40323 RepID=UPI0009B2B017|nr:MULTISPECIES: glycosyltransferase family 4 protein [Stenotrophomonas]MBA0353489.1 glycosyltransferase family 4 protein [Stenotrophomonas maltophilia]MBH1693852.1 glycosyltransferase family 4 protein [Stenotrophomonas maltophilia]MDH0550097.1 glycosyltransferase family 4 protein [Stenotrophomonas sp. GD04006]PJL51438.1 glycosyl transferase family 1 [Stenotrophomonas maltophilia]
MKICLVHDWLVTYAGSERVLSEISKAFPSADIFCIVDFLSEADRERITQGRSTKQTFIQKLPGAKKHYRNYLAVMPIAIEQLDLSSYDVIISSSHAVAKGVLTGPDQLHISYVHSPIRYAWDLQHQYLQESGLTTGPKSWLARAILHYVRLWDSRTSNGVDHFIANSKFIARRINKVYGRDADVIYPPVDVESFKFREGKEQFYLSASRLVPYKRMDLIVRAFSRLPDKQLVVIGDGPDMEKIRNQATPNVKILGHQPFESLMSHMQRAKAFVFAAEEDFGITPVEAQACGTPVIAFGKGGSLETVKQSAHMDESTGIWFSEQSEDSIIDAIYRFENLTSPILAETCRKHAERFSSDRFRSSIIDYVNSHWNSFSKCHPNQTT